MPAPVSVRTDFSARELRRVAATTKNANQSRRLLSLAAVLDGMSRTDAAQIGGMDRQTLRRGTGTGLAMPYVDTEAMQLHLDEISRTVARGAHAVLLLDRAGWHTTGNLNVPKNITLIFLPSRAPELNPVENVWQYLRQTWLSTGCLKPMRRSSRLGTGSWRNRKPSPQSACATGRTYVNDEGRWYD